MISKIKPLIPFLVVLPIVIWLYNPWQLYFLNDDAVYIPQSTHLHFRLGASFRPIADISLFLDSKLYGKEAWGFHFTNLLLHFCCTILLFFFVMVCLDDFRVKKSSQIAGLAAFLFLIYAFHSEAVLWILGRGGSLSTLFACLSLIFFAKRQKKNVYYYASLFFFICGLYTYESVWIIPLITSLWILFTVHDKQLKKNIIYASGFWIVFSFFLVGRKIIEGSFVGTPYMGDSFVKIDIKRYAYNYTALFFRSFIPPCSTTVFVILSLIVVAILGLIILYLAKQKLFSKFRLFTWISFLVSLVPYVMLGIDTHDSESERFLYLPSFFLCIILSDLFLLIQKKQIRLTVVCFWVALQLCFLYQTSASFKHSSEVARKTINEIQKANGRHATIYLIDLPTQYKGAYIFRVGFEPVLRWLAPKMEYKNFVKVSTKEIQTKKNFTVNTTRWREPHIEQFIIDKQIRFDSSELNVLMYWTDSAFLLVR